MIEKYLRGVYNEFLREMKDRKTLCELSGLHFIGGAHPNYAVGLVELLYILRYSYAYSFEYKLLFRRILAARGGCDGLRVTSLGCGNMIDYGSLTAAGGSDICYTGVDAVDWRCRYPVRAGDRVICCRADAGAYLNSLQVLDDDVYLFPKSISEFSDTSLGMLLTAFSRKPIRKNRFYLAVAVRGTGAGALQDLERFALVVSAAARNGFSVGEVTGQTRAGSAPYTYIDRLDDSYRYPDECKRLISNLSRCCSGLGCGNHCTGCAEILNRMPVLTDSQLNYRIVTMERRAA